MPKIRVRFDGKAFIPEESVQLPIGEIVEIQLPALPAKKTGSPAGLLEAMGRWPKLPPEDIAEMERLIEGGSSREAR